MLHIFRDRKRTYLIWVIVVIGTILSFVIGFNFLFGAGAGGERGKPTDFLGSVNGRHIEREQYEAMYNRNVEQYRERVGRPLDDAAQAYLRDQTWNTLITETVLADQARRMGLKATDREVVFAVRNMPPDEVLQSPAFQTNGQFDIGKYRRALEDPNMNWAGVEQYQRQMLPTQKLQVVGASMAKITDPEVEMAYSRSTDKAKITFVPFSAHVDQVKPEEVSRAEIEAYYHKHEAEFTRDAESNIAIVSINKQPTVTDQKAAEESAKGFHQQALKDTNFAAMAQQLSDEQVNTEQDGKPGRIVQMGQLVKNLEAVVFSLKPGEISSPVLSEGAYHIVKYIEPVADPSKPKRRIIDLTVDIKPGDETLGHERDVLESIRQGALKDGLVAEGKRRKIQVHTSGWFTQDTPPPALFQLPDIVNFAFSGKKGIISQIIDKPGTFLLVQIVDQRPAGKRSVADAESELRARAAQEKSVDKAEAKARQFLPLVSQNGSLEKASVAAKLQLQSPQAFTRSGPFPPELQAEPRVVGSAFGYAVGSVHLVRGDEGAYVVRVDGRENYDPKKFQALLPQLKNELYKKKQQEVMQTWMQQMLRDAKVQDLRAELGV